MERVYWIEYKEHRILFSNYADLSAEELTEAVAVVDAELLPKYRDLPPGSVLSLADVTNAVASKESIAALKNSVKKWQPLYKKQAVYGLSSFQRIFLNAVNKFSGGNIIHFDTREEALEWLIRGD